MPPSHVLADAIRFLSIDAVEQAQSGHPGMPMGMADIATVLWREFLKHNPADPTWVDRDRFVLSNGHGSMLLYSCLHLSGYELSLDEIKNFRQLGSQTPGHPEYGYTAGVETTTGPLGQGLANAVGMALTERKLAAEFNQKDATLIDHFTYVFLGDGCLMEGISHEACSFAGAQGLGKLIAFWDDNGISIDGEINDWCVDNVPERFRAYQWHVIADVDGHDPDQIRAAIEQARAQTDKPTMICCRTQIGYGAPNLVGTARTHGAPLGDDEVSLTRAQRNWPHGPFEIPDDIRQAWSAREPGQRAQAQWDKTWQQYQQAYPELAQDFTRRQQGKLPAFDERVKTWINELQANPQKIASRKASYNCISYFAEHLPELIGGSADLTGSNLTREPNATTLSHVTPQGNYIYYGVREFAMAAIMNGMALHGGVIPFGGTFLVFSDYARNAIRLSALMKQRVIYVCTHDSIGLGEDGPTHQPIEHLASLRLIPGLSVWRPCDQVETAVAWYAALQQEKPMMLALSRQGLPQIDRNAQQVAAIAKGGYIIFEPAQSVQAIIIATGSEVAMSIEAAQQLQTKGFAVRVVSMPSTDVFDAQSEDYREQVLPQAVTQRVAVEAGTTRYWAYYVGTHGKVIGIDRFGESAPAEQVYQTLNITTAAISQAVEGLLLGKCANKIDAPIKEVV